jgi:predicted dehydrogenase
MYRDGVMTHLSNIDTDWATGFINGTHDFLAAIREGRESELTGSEAREVLRFSMAIQLSAQEHREVSLDEITK